MFCPTCPFFAPFPEPSCRAEPPKGAVVPGPRGVPGVLGFWPSVSPEGWCGRHPDRAAQASIVQLASTERAWAAKEASTAAASASDPDSAPIARLRPVSAPAKGVVADPP